MELLAGSRAALAEIYDRHGAVVVGYARALLGERAAAEQVATDVFVGLARTPTGFDPTRGPLRAHLLEDAHRRSSQAGCRACEVPASRRGGPGGRLAVGDLPAEESRVLDLTLFGHHSYREAARLLAQPESVTMSRIRTGLHRLQGAGSR